MEPDALLQQRAQAGDQDAWGELLSSQQERLLRIIGLRMEPRLRNRVDPADIIQETFLEATRRRQEFFERSGVPLFIWLRLLALQKLAEIHRHHVGAKSRSLNREKRPERMVSHDTSAMIVAQLLGHTTTPSRIVAQAELEQRLRAALDQLDPLDREIIMLRNFEKLTNPEAAGILGLGLSTAGSRYVRAIRKLGEIMRAIGDFGGITGPGQKP
jgi:RNA polymerase sigma-70 factor, ECF subfamily